MISTKSKSKSIAHILLMPLDRVFASQMKCNRKMFTNLGLFQQFTKSGFWKCRLLVNSVIQYKVAIMINNGDNDSTNMTGHARSISMVLHYSTTSSSLLSWPKQHTRLFGLLGEIYAICLILRDFSPVRS